MSQEPTGVFVRLPLTAEHLNKFQHYRNGGCKPDVVVRAIGTPVTGTELYPIGYINEDAIRGLATGVYQSTSIFRDEDKEHYDTVALVRQSDAQAQIAARDSEIVRLREALSRISTASSNKYEKTYSCLKFCINHADEALKGGAA